MANYDYLRWDAASIQQLLRRKLLESNIYTDQLYPGSDTKILIDLFAWTFDVLTYIMNNTAAEALFQDTQIYENINRLVKILSYNPHGYITSNTTCNILTNTTFNFNINNRLTDTCIIPKFSKLSLNKTDKYGNPITFSFIQDFIFNTYNNTIITPKILPIIYNGQFKKFNTVFTAIGIPYEVFTLAGLTPDSTTEPTYIDHNNFHVYIQKANEQTGQLVYTQWKSVSNLALDALQNDEVCQIRLNQYKLYTIKFGDNIHGKQIPAGSNIHVIYLQTNGQQGIIDANVLNTNLLQLSIPGFQTDSDMINICFNGYEKFKQNYGSLFVSNGIFVNNCQKLSFSNMQASTMPQLYETVDTIKNNAPNIFKMGNRLITLSDFRQYILANYTNFITDIWVCNNTEYTTIFYNWLLQYNKLNINIRTETYKFANACDFNNVYLWLRFANNISNSQMVYNTIINDCNNKKCATAQLIPCMAISTKFIPYILHPRYENTNEDIFTYVLNNIKIRIVKKQNVFINNEQIREQVNTIILQYFSNIGSILGTTIDFNLLQKKIMQLRIHTIN